MTRSAIITGNLGFVGRHFDRLLQDAGWDIYRVDNRGGYDARQFFMSPVPQSKADLVIHCAAVVGGRETIDGAPLALASNLALDAGLFQWALRHKPRHVVYFSSSAVYPVMMQTGTFGLHGANEQLHENMVDPDFSGIGAVGLPDQLYGWAKLTGENLAWRAHQEGLKVSVVRPFSGYGSDQEDTYPFPAFIDRALRREDPFTVWGDGQQVRDFIHIDDIVGAVMAMVEEGIDGPVNLATGRATSLNDLARLVCEGAGYSPEIDHVAAKPVGVRYRVGYPGRLQQFYSPAITLEEGIEMALAYRSRT